MRKVIFQMMVEITESPVGARHVEDPVALLRGRAQQGFAGERFSKPRPGTLTPIIRSFRV